MHAAFISAIAAAIAPRTDGVEYAIRIRASSSAG